MTPPTSKVRTGKTQLIAVRLPHDLIARLDAIAAALSVPGIDVTRAEAIRAAVTAGLPVLEQGRLVPPVQPPQTAEPSQTSSRPSKRGHHGNP